MLRDRFLAGALAFGLMLTGALTARAQQPSEQLDRLVQQLRSDPSNQALRKQIISLANSMNPKPSAPDAFYKLLGAAGLDFRDAQNKEDYLRAAKEFGDASLRAPWVADVYFDLGQADEKAERYSDAVQSFQLYLLAAPDAKDRGAIEKRILEDGGAAEADARRAAQSATPPPSAEQPSSQNPAARRPQSDADFIRSLNGAKYERQGDLMGGDDTNWPYCKDRLTVEGAQLHDEDFCEVGNPGHVAEYTDNGRYAIVGRQAVRDLNNAYMEHGSAAKWFARCSPLPQKVVFQISREQIIVRTEDDGGREATYPGWTDNQFHCSTAGPYVFKRVR